MRGAIALACAAVLAIVAWAVSAPLGEARRLELAQEQLGEVLRVDLPRSTAYASGGAALLFFATRGVAGPIEGFVRVHELAADEVVAGAPADGPSVTAAGKIVVDEVVLLRSREGLEHDALDERHLAQYRGRRGDAPIVVDAVSGATISSRALGDAVHRCIRDYSRWIQARDARLRRREGE